MSSNKKISKIFKTSQISFTEIIVQKKQENQIISKPVLDFSRIITFQRLTSQQQKIEPNSGCVFDTHFYFWVRIFQKLTNLVDTKKNRLHADSKYCLNIYLMAGYYYYYYYYFHVIDKRNKKKSFKKKQR